MPLPTYPPQWYQHPQLGKSQLGYQHPPILGRYQHPPHLSPERPIRIPPNHQSSLTAQVRDSEAAVAAARVHSAQDSGGQPIVRRRLGERLGEPTEVCTPPLPLDDIAMIFGPAEEARPNLPCTVLAIRMVPLGSSTLRSSTLRSSAFSHPTAPPYCTESATTHPTLVDSTSHPTASPYCRKSATTHPTLVDSTSSPTSF
jgi:hypothetical protein